MTNKISIEVYQQDWMPGFAAFVDDGEIDQGKAHILLNVGAAIAAVEVKDIAPAEIPYFVAESLMHEFFHVIEAWAKVEFSEERVERLVDKYREKYTKEKA